MIKKLFSFIILLQIISQHTQAQPGLKDRALWVKYLDKIVWPVVGNLANGTLKKNMPLELGPQYGLNAKAVTYLEAVGRCFSGIAPWVELNDGYAPETALRQKYRAAIIKGLTEGANPQSPDYLNFDNEPQCIVDAAYLALTFLRAPKTIWEPLDAATKSHYIAAFKSLRNRSGAYNNWLLFAGLTEGFLYWVNEAHDPARVAFALHKMNEWYVGDGWYSDGERFSMDNYNSYVIQPMLVDLLGILKNKNSSYENAYQASVKRMVRYAEYLERSISPEGTYAAYGRSVTYRTAAFQALAQVALMHRLPDYVLPAQVRCGLTKVFYNMYEGGQNFDGQGWLVLGFNGHQPQIADTYTSTGSLYMATLGFLPLGLPVNDPFWAAPPADWTSKKAWSGQPVKKDYKVEY